MVNIDVVLKIPDAIAAGLANGTLQRVGGVVVDTTSKQVVAWLRDGGVVDIATRMTGAMNPLNFIGMLAQSATSLISTVVTAHKLDGLQQSVNVLTDLTGQVLDGVRVSNQLAGFTLTGQLMNMGLMTVSFQKLTRRLEQMQTALEQGFASLEAEFKRDRYIEFVTAVRAARDFLESDRVNTRSAAYRSALDGMNNAKLHFLEDYRIYHQKSEENAQHLELAHIMLTQALYASSMRIKCYVANEDFKLAHDDIREDLTIFKKEITALIHSLLEKHGAVYFHGAVGEETLDRFLCIQGWLEDKDLQDPRILFELVNRYRPDFWNPGIIEDDYGEHVSGRVRRIIQRPEQRFEDRVKTFNRALTSCELLIENYNRLEGFDIEVRSERLSNPEWQEKANMDNMSYDTSALKLLLEKDYFHRSGATP
jgi:hypothetical protein